MVRPQFKDVAKVECRLLEVAVRLQDLPQLSSLMLMLDPTLYEY